MATASVDCGMLWTEMEGRELPGGWRLRRLVRPEGRKAWFDAIGPEGDAAIVCLTETLNDEDELLARLRAAAAIHHPNVVGVRDARLMWMNETPVVLAAMERTEENLAEVLRERALEPLEARQLLHGLIQGVAAIHARRLVHGRMEAGSVLAMGDTVKLRSDCLHAEGFATGAGEDVRGVGRIVTQAVTRRIPGGENDPLLGQVPETMQGAVRRALSGNATIEEVAALAGVRLAKSAEPGLPRSFGEASRAATSTVTAFRKPQEWVKKAEEPAAAAEKQLPRIAVVRREEAADHAEEVAEPVTAQMDLPLIPRWEREAETDEEPEDTGESRLRGWLSSVEGLAGKSLGAGRGLLKRWNYHRRGAPWVVGAAVGLMLATVLMLHSWLDGGRAAKSTAQSPRVVVENATPARAAAPVARAAGAARVWRVVVYTYRRRSEAEQRAGDVARRYPQLRPAVMATRGGDFLVTVGGAMSREQALALRGRAVSLGLPQDSYAQNFHAPGV